MLLDSSEAYEVFAAKDRRGGGRVSSAGSVEEIKAIWRKEPRMLFRITLEVWRAIELRVYRGKRADQEYQAAQSGR